MDSSSGLSYILLVVLVALSAFFSASETALNSINKIRMKNMADNGDQRAAKTLEVAEKYESMISTILIGNKHRQYRFGVHCHHPFYNLVGSR